ncbi:CDP-alcohol phosphatidyltransferase [Flavobacterium rivuli WB 3.3-2 = DSM 21788]|uniref:CDP-alcohol phosphatidyltransferase n=1 Tax=Flavobacterium rivuli WB 3.3-2 = DSM 21788 TaxID=1121895 RepID=A0A0A2M7R4_9FLAO|nr:CDP-alcohol phosphatidyltransferase family protein [Flavobacterium rivuli]KGO87651.1 CDP-alcohol phosphatidyltransferase [Flavobacterium rivuli WB 3.3-2 = DSM 21788]
MKNIPYILIAFRLVLGPVMIAVTYNYGTAARMFLALLILLGILSDIFDGIIARKHGVSTERLRRMDSQIDVVFWLCTGWCAWLLNPEIIKNNRYAIATIFIMEALTYVFSFLKFGKETCTHALLSKLWGITLFAAFISIIGFGYGGIPLALVVIFGILSHIDVYLIILLLPRWMHDVPSCYHAWLIRQGKDIKRNKLFNG